jgi:hypothetical protein
LVEAANTIMVPCQPTTARMHSNPVCRRLGIDAQIMEPTSIPTPKNDISKPSPTESLSSTSRAKMGISVVWNENPVVLMITATIRAAHNNC